MRSIVGRKERRRPDVCKPRFWSRVAAAWANICEHRRTGLDSITLPDLTAMDAVITLEQQRAIRIEQCRERLVIKLRESALDEYCSGCGSIALPQPAGAAEEHGSIGIRQIKRSERHATWRHIVHAHGPRIRSIALPEVKAVAVVAAEKE